MNWLAVDTAMNACGVGIRRADGQFFSRVEGMERGQAERLMPLVLEVAGQAGLALQDMDAYAVTMGPGTFTGIRVGLATVRALALVSGKPSVGIETFDALAASVPERPACILIETKRTDYYVRLYENGVAHEGTCLSPEELRVFLQPHWLLAGDAVTRAQAETGCKNPVRECLSVDTEKLIECAEKSLKSGVLGMPDPVYLRPADVSVSRRRNARIV